MIQVLFQGGEETDFEEAQAQVVCKIDFVNAQICSELKTIVSEWYDALPENGEEHTLIKFLIKNKIKIHHALVTFFLIAAVILLNFIMRYFISRNDTSDSINTLSDFYLISTWSLVVLYVFYVSGKVFSNKVLEKRIGDFNRNPMFELTKGDENKIGEIKRKNNKIFKKLLWDLIITIGINIITYFIGKFLPIIIHFWKG